MAKSQNSIFIVVVIAVLAMAAGIFLRGSEKPKSLPEFEKLIVLPQSKTINGVNFIDQDNLPFGKNELQGYWSLVFFGFTNCPDVCPTTMNTLKQVKLALEKEGTWGNYQVILVSVDPARDTPEKLGKYVPFFDESFIGLSSDLATTTEFARQLGVLFVAHPTTELGNYDVDHSAAIILLNPKGEMAGVLSAPHKSAQISKDLLSLANFHSEDHRIPPTKSEQAARPITEPKTSSAPSNPQLSNNGIVIMDAWIRPAPPAAPSLAAYLTLVNNSEEDLTIVDVDSTQFDNAMIHKTVLDGEMSEMHHVNELVIPAQGSITLEPSALHIMLVGPDEDFKEGEHINLELLTDTDQIINVDIEIRNKPE